MLLALFCLFASVAANDERNTTNIVVRNRVVACSATKFKGVNMATWQYSNSTAFRMLVELYFDQPLLPHSYFHECTLLSPYLLRLQTVAYHEQNAFYGKTNVLTTTAARCLPPPVNATRNLSTVNTTAVHTIPVVNTTACLCDASRQYSLSALVFILMRANERGAAPVVDMERIHQVSDAMSILANVAEYATIAQHSFNAARYALAQSHVPQRVTSTAVTSVVAAHGATIASCFAREWYTHDNTILYKHFPELTPWRQPGDAQLRRHNSRLPPNVHVLIPTKRPQGLTRCLASLHDLADLSFGVVQFHFGIDWKDNVTHSAVDAACSSLGLHCMIHEVFSRGSDVSAIVNHMFTTIDDKGYFMRFNDDSEMLTVHWNRKAIDALRREPIDAGLSWLVDLSNLGLQTHSFVSSVHRDVFGYYFPMHFKNIYEDDWITGVYNGQFAKPSVVRLRHVAKTMRYQPLTIPRDVLTSAIAQARVRVARHILRNRSVFYPSLDGGDNKR